MGNYTKDNVVIPFQTNYSWQNFEIMRFDASSTDFYTQEYMIEWEDDPVSNQHGGYFLSYDNGEGINSDTFIRDGGPMWWWYNGQTIIRPYGSHGDLQTQISLFADNTVFDAFRKKNRMKFKFISNTQMEYTWIISGLEHSYTVGTYGGWTFSSKTSIELRYHTWQTHPLVAASPHEFIVYKII